MKLHMVTYVIDDDTPAEVTLRKFAGSESDASKMATALKKEHKLIGKPEREAIEIPTDKAGLLEWLNKNATVHGLEFAG